MFKTLLASSSLSLALLVMPMGSIGPLATSGAAGLTPAIASGIDIGGGITIGDEDDGIEIEVGIGDDDDDDDDDDEDEGGIEIEVGF